jgi:3-oxoacyl-[acyl-carrier-protein] synthase-3
VDKTGVEERRFTTASQTASDLCFAAAEQLFLENSTDKSEIDILLFVSQTPDFRMPATSVTLQHRLGLPKSTAAFDIGLGCSGFVYGLSVAYAYANMPQVRKVLLLDGETRSKVYHPKDRKTGFIFGDAAVAAIIEKQDSGTSYFSLNSDGSKSDLIKIDAGGYRNPSNENTTKEKVVDEHGNIRTDEHGYMNGADVFNFVLREIPKNIKNTLAFSNTEIGDLDFYVFHQANKFMNDYLAKKLKLDLAKVPSSIHKYGNTSSVSIPITIVDALKGKLDSPKKLLLCGFGVGMSWATAVINTKKINISTIVEV